MSTDLVPVDVDKVKVLAAFGLNVRDPNAQAALMVCQRYDLDPLLKHVQLIKQAVYVTRDGYLHVAHKSGVFDGMQIDDEGETPAYYWAKVSVWRKDMSRPFTAKARCGKNERVFGDPWDMAVTRAERRALKRAFDVSGLGVAGDYDEHEELFDATTGVADVMPANAALDPPRQTFEEPPLPDEPLNATAVETPAQATLDVDDDGATGPQLRMMFALLKGLGVEEDDRHVYIGEALGRPVDSFNDLSKADATKAIDHMKSAGVTA